MRILFDLTSLFHNYSGVERYAEKISSCCISMDKSDEFVLVFKNEIAPCFIRFCSYDNVKIIVLKGKSKLVFNQLILPFALYNIKADAYVFLAFPEPWLFFNKKIITAVHDMAPWDCGSCMPVGSRLYYRLSHIHTMLFASRIVTISRFSGRRICRYAGVAGKAFRDNVRKRLRLVYCGVDKTFQQDISEGMLRRVREKYNLPDRYILSLATLEPRKNIKLLIEAYKNIMDKDKPGLVLAGRAGWKLEEALGCQNDSGNIMVTGFVDEEDLPALYKGCELFVFPSKYEGFGMPPLEAVESGCRVLVSDIPVHREILKERALYFKAGDALELSEKIKGCLKNKEDSQKPCDEQFTWERASVRLIKILRELG